MKYWFNKDSEKNNIVILTENALLISSVAYDSMRSINHKLELEVHPREIFGGENLQVIPLDFLHSMVSCSTDPVLEINFISKRQKRREVIGFIDFESKREFVVYFDNLLAQVKHNKLIKNEMQQPVYFSLLLPLLSLILGVFGTYLYFNQFRFLSIIVGGLWITSSLFILLKHAIRPPKVVSWTIQGNTRPQICRNKHAVIAYSVLAVIGVTEAVSSFFIPNVSTPIHLYKSIENKGFSYSIREFLEGDSSKSPLIDALQQKDEVRAISLLNTGADLSKRYVGETALDIAIKNNLNKAIETMLKENSPSSNTQNLLIRAVKAGNINHENLDKIMLMVDDINYKDKSGLTALGNAVINGSKIDVIQCLLENGATQNIEIENMSLVEYVAKKENKPLAELLQMY